MKRSAIYLTFLMLCAAGCTVYQIDSNDTSLDYYPPKKSVDDVMYQEKVDKPYVEIGVVTVSTERRQTLEDVLPQLKREAAIMGGDVITDIQTNATGSWEKVKNIKFLSNAYIRAKFSAKVLVLK